VTARQMFLDAVLMSVAAPLLLHALLRVRPGLDRALLPAAIAFPVFVVSHGCLVILGSRMMDGAGRIPALPPVPLVLGLVFWAPVFGDRRRLPQPARFCYLYLALPLLDLPAGYLIAIGQSGAGVAMMAGMIPIAAVAVVDTWRWISLEERAASQVPA
jgi:hypothetical protein